MVAPGSAAPGMTATTTGPGGSGASNVNVSAALVPAGVVIVTGAGPAVCAGLVTVARLPDGSTVSPVPAVPPKSTAVAPVRSVPMISTSVPPVSGPDVGISLVIVGGPGSGASGRRLIREMNPRPASGPLPRCPMRYSFPPGWTAVRVAVCPTVSELTPK
jgi:hypothetical protein